MSRPRILFLGSKALGLRVLGAVRGVDAGDIVGVVTVDDSSDGERSALSRFRSEVTEGLFVVDGPHAAAALVRELRPDLVVVSGWYFLIKPETLRAVPRGFVGFHGSLLPAYRGGSPIVWQMILGAGQPERPFVGLSLFQFGEGIDDGPLWAQTKVPVGPEDYIADVLANVEDEAARLMRTWLPVILEGKQRPVPQQGAPIYCGMRRPEDGKLDWRWTAPQIASFVHAQSHPYTGAFSALQANPPPHGLGAVLRIWRARVAPGVWIGVPGQVMQIDGGDVIVACGRGTALRVERVEVTTEGGEGIRDERTAAEEIGSLKVRLPS